MFLFKLGPLKEEDCFHSWARKKRGKGEENSHLNMTSILKYLTTFNSASRLFKPEFSLRKTLKKYLCLRDMQQTFINTLDSLLFVKNTDPVHNNIKLESEEEKND